MQEEGRVRARVTVRVKELELELSERVKCKGTCVQEEVNREGKLLQDSVL